MVESHLRWFGHVWRRLVEAPIRKVNQMEGSLIARDRGRTRKTTCETIKRDLDFNSLNVNMIYDKTLWHRLIHITNST